MLHPITFSIPEEKIITPEPEKSKIVSSLIPGRLETYIYNTEKDYYEEYKKSMFAITMKKAGWDCMRHYEILACGTIPYFVDIHSCPPNTMALLPKQMFIEGNQLFERINGKTKLDNSEVNEYFNLRKRLLDYTKTHLKTKAMATYVLEKSNHSGAKNILYLSGDTKPDYLRCLTLHGFKKLLGTSFHDYPKIPHVYESGGNQYKTTYGRGYTYSNILKDNEHNDELDANVEEDIKNKKYDIVIYPSFHRGMPFYDLVSSVYKPNEIILFCGEDIHSCDYNKWLKKGHHVFVREL